MDIVKNIIKIRNEKGISQQVIADALGVDASAVSNIENGKRELRACELVNIAAALGVNATYLLTYPEVYVSQKTSDSTKVVVEFDVSADEFIKLGLKDKILQVLNK